MLADIPVAVLGAPALLLAGLASSGHCALMCGALHAQAARGAWWPMHAGRVTAYGLVGAVAGGAGQWLLHSLALLPAAEALRLVALGLCLVFALWALGQKPARSCCPAAPRVAIKGTSLRRFAAGLLAGLVPCPLLLAAAGYATLSGSAVQGAWLLIAFGLGTVPAVQAGAWAWGRVSSPVLAPRVQQVALLLAIGSALLMSAALLDGAGLRDWCLGVVG